VDHDLPGVGKLCTVFSAPDYPQFVEADDVRHHNKGAYVVLSAAGDFAVPEPVSFSAVKPRQGGPRGNTVIAHHAFSLRCRTSSLGLNDVASVASLTRPSSPAEVRAVL